MNEIIKFTDVKNASELTEKYIVQTTSVNFENKTCWAESTSFVSLSKPIIINNTLTQKGIDLINKHEYTYLYSIQEINITHKNKVRKWNYNIRGFKK